MCLFYKKLNIVSLELSGPRVGQDMIIGFFARALIYNPIVCRGLFLG